MSRDGVTVPDPHVIVLCGALGDLSRRKLLPGLYRLDRAGLMPGEYRIFGTSRRGGSDDDFRAFARKAIGEAADGDGWERFAQRLSFRAFSGQEPGPLVEAVAKAERELGGEPRRLHYLSIPPTAFGDAVSALGDSGLADRARVVLEKPFGIDLESARALNALVHGVLPEERVFRIDHFLGREAVQNLIALRFANGMYEPIWNRDHIDHVQIDVPETLAVDARAGFYESTGAYRDMVVTHLFHVLGFVAMEPPTTLEARSIAEETGKVFRSVSRIDPDSVIRGQYAGYRDGDGVAPDSQTETFIAMRASIDNWRWDGVPFFLRTGKRLGEERRLLTIAFREPPRRMFRAAGAFVEDYGPDHISFDLGDPGGITASFLAKVPGPQMRLGQARMEFTYEGSFGTEGLQPYERLMYDAMLGDRTLFTNADGIEDLWAASADLLEDPPPLHRYAPGSYGPQKMHELIAPRRWWLPET
ncbi:MAG: glucose-6-phosphate 1-dehydrogenase [Solirubrobacteraceae bacterium]|jgi:glucose-6-phosphate 1-dehydrogenase|nr:glucose-6-phosphate 1-dehydrogenase [Solirubrobacteraceae bacterium]